MAKGTCSIEGCEKPLKGRGWCDAHLWRWRKHGDPLGSAPPRLVRRGPRTCPGCGQTKDEDEFYDRAPRRGRQAGAKMSRCKVCETERAKGYNRAHPEVVRAWAADNRDRAAAAQRRYRDSPQGKNTLRRLETRRDPTVRAARSARRRARQAGVTVEMVTVAEVLRRHGRWCGICQTPIQLDDRVQIDHIVPLARGGEHSYANTQPAHVLCNQRKGARLPIELQWAPDQLIMPLP